MLLQAEMGDRVMAVEHPVPVPKSLNFSLLFGFREAKKKKMQHIACVQFSMLCAHSGEAEEVGNNEEREKKKLFDNIEIHKDPAAETILCLPACLFVMRSVWPLFSIILDSHIPLRWNRSWTTTNAAHAIHTDQPKKKTYKLFSSPLFCAALENVKCKK